MILSVVPTAPFFLNPFLRLRHCLNTHHSAGIYSDQLSWRCHLIQVWDCGMGFVLCLYVYVNLYFVQKKLDLSLISRVYRNERCNWMCSREASKKSRMKRWRRSEWLGSLYQNLTAGPVCSAASDSPVFMGVCMWWCVWVAVRVYTIGRCAKSTIFATITIYVYCSLF